MGTPGAMLRGALAALTVYKIDAAGLDVEPGREPTYDDVRRYYEGRLPPGANVNRAIAEGAGYTRGTREYKTFLRSLQRYGAGEGKESRREGWRWRQMLPKLPQPKRKPRRRTMRQVLNLIARRGVIVLGFAGMVRISRDERWRQVEDVFIPAGELHDQGFFPPAYAGDWPEAAFAFANAWGNSWGPAPPGLVDWEDVEELTLQIGEVDDDS